ncbi:DNA/RNA nuclease SfsA [Aestuariibacter halophilus]|uniref:Sugar fermentation stimulation protein homolog n=1 Tax=Fluctibacter halophilus TaxID=226011 RepID=A0ABS8G9H7_9ALTE|nr:DNA/RNA nuclease SfsA [Aestuariibacter halophilus]MCC2617158.1 DNA/RNA nuclease SfsA [Aestuariibacter halophilus]
MKLPADLLHGHLLQRYKRFLADVQLDDGTTVTAHCPNTGAMTGCAEPGFDAWLSHHDDPKRKLKYTWELARNHAGHYIGINTHRANKVVAEALSNGTITALAAYNNVRSEVRYGEQNSRIDFLLQAADLPDCYLEVKSVTLLADDGLGYFPDAKSARGVKHLHELASMVQQGHRAVLLFCVQHSGIHRVSDAAHIDPQYSQALDFALKNGVEVMAWGCHIDSQNITLNQQLPFEPAFKG